MTISSSNELEEFVWKILAEDFLKNFNRPATKWKSLWVTTLVFYINHLVDAPLSGPVEFPDFLLHNRGVKNHTSNDNLCFFRCLSIFRGCDKQLFSVLFTQTFITTAYCKHLYIDPDHFQGVLLIDFPEIEDFLRLISLFTSSKKKKRN